MSGTGSKYWDAYWKRQERPKKCSVCEDTGIVSGERDNYDHSGKVIPCPMNCESVKSKKGSSHESKN